MLPAVESSFCQFLEWDSRFFGRNIGRLAVPRLATALVPTVFEWCRANQIACLYFLADADHAETTQLAAENGFQLVDIRVTLEHGDLGRSFPTSQGLTDVASADRRPALDVAGAQSRSQTGAPSAGGAGIRPFGSGDLPALRELAGRSHRDSRFFFDPHFPSARSQALFETWIEKSCHDDREQVFVAEAAGKPAGYITCQRVNEQTGQIGLLGVDAAAQGRGFGSGLIQSALHWFAARGANRAVVVTQGRNVRAQRLYQRCGFATAALQLWYHRWFEGAPSKGEP